MAGRVTRTQLGVLLSTTANVRLSREQVQVVFADATNPPRVTREQVQVVYRDRTYPPRMTRVQTQVVYNDRTNPVRVTKIATQVLMSVTQGAEPATIQRAQPPIPEREINPYKTTTPISSPSTKSDPTLAAHLREQTETVRKQHMITQAGDTTFPWEQLTKVGQTQLYHMGALGKFFHDDYGIIQARFVQFAGMVAGNFINGPAGRLKDSAAVDWIVTNDFTKSGSALVSGVIASLNMPADGDFGWLIVNGANISELPIVTEVAGEPYQQHAELLWVGTEQLATGGLGAPFGRVWFDDRNQGPKMGTVFIDVEGASRDLIVDGIAQRFVKDEDLIQALDDRVKILEEEPWAQEITDLQKGVSDLEAGLSTEIEARKRDTLNLKKALAATGGGDATQADLQKLSDALTAAYKLADDQLATKVNQLANQLGASQGGTGAVTIQGLQDQITGLAKLINTHNVEVPLIPMVVGFPPVLVYDEDGNLVYVEAY